MDDKNLDLAKQFIQQFDESLAQLRDTKGEQFALVAKNAFRTLQIPPLMMIILEAEDEEDFSKRFNAVLMGITEIVSGFLGDMAAGMTEEQNKETMDFADRMFALQQSMIGAAHAHEAGAVH